MGIGLTRLSFCSILKLAGLLKAGLWTTWSSSSGWNVTVILWMVALWMSMLLALTIFAIVQLLMRLPNLNEYLIVLFLLWWYMFTCIHFQIITDAILFRAIIFLIVLCSLCCRIFSIQFYLFYYFLGTIILWSEELRSERTEIWNVP